jgi:hypothetical protein
MGFRREMEYRIGLESGERSVHSRLIADIGFQQTIAAFNLFQRLDVAGVGKFVDNQNVPPFAAKMPHQRRTDKAATAGNYATLILHR